MINYDCHPFDILLCFLDLVAKPTSIITREVPFLLISKDFYSTASSGGFLRLSYNKSRSFYESGFLFINCCRKSFNKEIIIFSLDIFKKLWYNEKVMKVF